MLQKALFSNRLPLFFFRPSFRNPLFLLAFPAVTLLSCAGGNTIQKPVTALQASAPETVCDRTIKYIMAKVVITQEDGTTREVQQEVELTLEPARGKMTQKEIGGGGRSEEIVITQKHCSLTAGMKSGEAVYELVDKDEHGDGSTTESVVHLKVVATDGSVQLFVSSPDKEGGAKMDISRWEVID